MIDLKKVPNDIARIDIDRAGASTLFIRAWKRGFNQGDAGAPDIEDVFDGGSLSTSEICSWLEVQSFSVTMSSVSKARALRGPVTRVDFVRQSDGWRILKYHYGWTATTRPVISGVAKTKEEIEAAITWCETNGWIVRKWDGGARAWKDKLRPIRDANGIRAMRRKATEELRRGVVGTNRIFYDFAFDF